MDVDWNCVDCKINVSDIKEYAYIVKDEIWPIAFNGGMLCIGCLENRIGRKLTPNDFDPVPPLNMMNNCQSDRLLDRLGVVKIQE